MAGTGALEGLTWLGILFCLIQPTIFSGLNLAMFGISRLRLEVEVSSANQAAERILAMRMSVAYRQPFCWARGLFNIVTSAI